MEYVNIPDDLSKNSIQKSIWRIKSQFNKNSHSSFKGKLIISIFSILFLYIYILPFFKFKNYHNNLQNLNSFPKNYNMKTSYTSLINKYNKLPDNLPIRAQLAFNFPYDEYAPIPHNIFQTWKVKPDNINFKKEFIGTAKSWPKENENFIHTIITDDMLDEWVSQEFSNIPDIIKAWNLLPKIILKADFFRYLIIFARGGVYSDMDTFCLKPITNWAPFKNENTNNNNNSNNNNDNDNDNDNDAEEKEKKINDIKQDKENSKIGFAIGIEADPDRPDWSEWYARRIQFVQWTIVGKRGHPFLRELISRIVEETFRKEKLGKLKSIEGKDHGADIMQWTGPGIYTDTMFDYLNNILTDGKYGDGFGIGTKYWNEGSRFNLKHQEVDNDGMPLNADKMLINYKNFMNLQEPVVYDDIMILPITSFSPGVAQMGSQSPRHPLAFVLHNFSGTWKPESEKMN
jgi:alpha 1,6-mannosyltransferase